MKKETVTTKIDNLSLSQFNEVHIVDENVPIIFNQERYTMKDIVKVYKVMNLIKTKKIHPQRLLMYKKHRDFYNMDMPEDRQLTFEEFNLCLEVLL